MLYMYIAHFSGQGRSATVLPRHYGQGWHDRTWWAVYTSFLIIVMMETLVFIPVILRQASRVEAPRLYSVVESAAVHIATELCNKQ